MIKLLFTKVSMCCIRHRRRVARPAGDGGDGGAGKARRVHESARVCSARRRGRLCRSAGRHDDAGALKVLRVHLRTHLCACRVAVAELARGRAGHLGQRRSFLSWIAGARRPRPYRFAQQAGATR